MSFNDSFAGYLLFEIMMRVLNNKIEKMKKGVDIKEMAWYYIEAVCERQWGTYCFKGIWKKCFKKELKKFLTSKKEHDMM